jgi:hypothetical protein
MKPVPWTDLAFGFKVHQGGSHMVWWFLGGLVIVCIIGLLFGAVAYRFGGDE